MKDMIIRGGENIYPREIVGAFAILKKGAGLTEDDIRDYASSQISRYKVPKHVFFVDNYPLTEVVKSRNISLGK